MGKNNRHFPCGSTSIKWLVFLMKTDCSCCEVLTAKETADNLKITTEVDYDLCEVQAEGEEYSSI